MSLLFAGCPLNVGKEIKVETCFKCKYFTGKQNIFYGVKRFCSYPKIYGNSSGTIPDKKWESRIKALERAVFPNKTNALFEHAVEIEKLQKIVVGLYNRRYESVPNLQELIVSIKEKPVNRKAVEEDKIILMRKSEPEKVQCPKCKSTNLDRGIDREIEKSIWRCTNCGCIFSDKPIEYRTELQKEIEGLKFSQLVSRFVEYKGAFGIFQDSLIYIDWLYREIISDLQKFDYTQGLTNIVKMRKELIKKYEKLFKEKAKK